MINKMIFENYKDYLLSLNIAQISREFGFNKLGMNSFYLLTNVIRKFIEKISIDTQKQVEDSGRNECNIIDILYTLLDDKNISQRDIMFYINSSKIKYDFTKNNYIHKLFNSEEKERNNLIKKINHSSLKIREEEDINNININPNLIKAIPPMLRYFPMEYKKGGIDENEDDENQKKINIINNMLEDNKNKKMNSGLTVNERKNVEELNNTANYFDMSKKHSFHKKNVDFSKIFNNIIVIKDNFVLGKKHSRYLLADKKENGDNDNDKDKEKSDDDAYEGLKPNKQLKLN